MPVTKSRTAFYDINLDQANTTGFLFGDDDNVIEGKLYTQANNEDNFPVLRREPNMVSQEMVSSTVSTSFSPFFPRTFRHWPGLFHPSASCAKAFWCSLRWWSLASHLHLPSPFLPTPCTWTWELAYFLPVWLTFR